MKRGYLFTIISYLLIFSIFTVAYNYYTVSLEEREDAITLNSMDKVSRINDDIGTDITSIFGMSINISNSTGNTTIELKDVMGGSDFESDLLDYIDYTNTEYKSLVGANVSLSSSTEFKIVPTDITFNYSDTQKSEIIAYGEDISGFVFQAILEETEEELLLDRQDGPFPFYFSVGEILRADDNDPSYCNKYLVNFTEGGNINISMGACYGESNLIRIVPTGVSPLVALQIATDYNENISIDYGINVTITDWGSGIIKHGKPVLSR